MHGIQISSKGLRKPFYLMRPGLVDSSPDSSICPLKRISSHGPKLILKHWLNVANVPLFPLTVSFIMELQIIKISMGNMQLVCMNMTVHNIDDNIVRWIKTDYMN